MLTIIVQLVTLGFLGRLLQPSDFGAMGVLLIIVGFSKIISEFGMGAAIIQKKEVAINEQRTVMLISIIIATMLTILFYFSANLIGEYFNNLHLIEPLKVISFVFIIDSIVVIQTAMAQKEMDFKFISLTAFISYFFGNALLTIILAYLGYNLWALVFGYFFTSIISMISYLTRFKNIIKSLSHINSKKYFSFSRDLFYFSTYFTIGRIANYCANRGDYFIIGKVLGIESLGYYTRAQNMISRPANLLGNTLQKVLFPAFSKIQKQTEQLREYYLIGNRLLSYITLIISPIIIIWASEIVYIILGDGWDQVVFPLKILAYALVFRLGYKTTTPIMNAMGLVKIRSYTEIVYFILIIIGSYIGSFYGINGSSIGVLISIIINFIITNYICLKYLNLPTINFLQQYIKPMIISFGISISLLLFHQKSYYCIISTFFVIILFLGIYKMNGFKKEVEIMKGLIK